MARLSGRIALVTGAAQGIGKAVAPRLAADGADVAVADIKKEAAEATAQEIRALGRRAAAIGVDLSDVGALLRMVDEAEAALGPLFIVVNVAGIVQSRGFFDVNVDDWDRIIDVNQRATAFLMQTAGKRMVDRLPEAVRAGALPDRCWGKIVNFSSISGRRGRPLQIHYAASKAAVISLTQSGALALAPYGINVNAVSPSVVYTPMYVQNNKEKAQAFGVDPNKSNAEFVARIPLRRAGTCEEMAAAVSFLCSEDSDYITGQTLNVDGGFEMN